MNKIEEIVSQHYAHGSLGATILAALGDTTGQTPQALLERLAGIDEFHVGGRAATAELAAQLQLSPGLSVLDIGCGLGGTARFLAVAHGCDVTGIDITAEYVETGNILNAKLGLQERISLRCASALELPFPPARFDRATMLHVGMNIPDKAALFTQIARVLKPGGVLAVYDVMRLGDGPLTYPVPWAADEATSFLDTPAGYRGALAAAGMEVVVESNQREMALDFFAKVRERMAQAAPPPLGLHVLMGSEARQKLANLAAGVEAGVIAPVRMLARRNM